LSATNTLRSGYTVSGLTGVLEQRFGVYRVQPVGPVSFSDDNPRPLAPDGVGGRIKVSAMNVLNYFTTLDASGAGPLICGPLANLECRGANTAAEFARQRDKIVSAIIGLDADVVGLMEIENNAVAAVQDLVDGLNAASGPGTYAFIDTGTIGTDAIKVGLIYRAGKVAPVGNHAILDSAVDPTFIDTLNRPVLAQTFEESLTGERFTVAVNHLKSKGSDCNAVGDPDTGDGQGNCNVTRTEAATALVNWLADDPTGSGDLDFLIIGDLNSYAMEDPIAAIRNAGYVNLIDTFVGSGAYSFVFQGQSGYLDHALASPALAAQATAATEWHVNADEPIVLDYNVEFKSANHVTTLYAPGPYRSSDHDPLVVGLNLDQTPPTLSVSVSPNVLWPPNHKYVTVNATVSVSDNVDPSPTVTLLSVTSNEPDDAPGDGDGNTTGDILIVDDFTFRLRAERSGSGSGRVYTITYQATDAHGNTTSTSATVTVPHSRGR
jgi:predicted extracellular nuclease